MQRGTYNHLRAERIKRNVTFEDSDITLWETTCFTVGSFTLINSCAHLFIFSLNEILNHLNFLMLVFVFQHSSFHFPSVPPPPHTPSFADTNAGWATQSLWKVTAQAIWTLDSFLKSPWPYLHRKNSIWPLQEKTENRKGGFRVKYMACGIR